jgi:nuclear receptor interaction protein
VLERGLESRRRMHRQYQITSENDMERRSGMHSSYVSRSMWQLLMNSGLGAQMENMEEMSRDAQDCAVM